MLFVSLICFLPESIVMLVNENPTKAPIRINNKPDRWKLVKMIPEINKIVPAEAPAGPKALSSLFFVITFLCKSNFLINSIHQTVFLLNALKDKIPGMLTLRLIISWSIPCLQTRVQVSDQCNLFGSFFYKKNTPGFYPVRA